MSIFDGLLSEKKYMKLQDGENKFRIVQEPITGFIDWKDKKPYRYRIGNQPPTPFDSEKPIKPFIACYVWDYEQEDLFILEMSQIGILKSLKSLSESEDWGDLKGYDLKITRSGTGALSKYAVVPCPHKALPPAIKKLLAQRPVKLEALFDGQDPWLLAEAEGIEEDEADFSQENPLINQLLLKFEMESIEIDGVEKYLSYLSKQLNKSINDIVSMALMPQRYEEFKSKYLNYLSNQKAA